MTLDEFKTKYEGRSIDFDGWYGAQCVDEMNQYLVDVLGITNPIQAFPGATAYEIYTNANNPQFDKIANTPTGVPQVGDIVFWDTSIGSAGHVAIFLSGDANSFTSLDQNWPTGSVVHEQKHDYNGVCGWLHFKPVAATTDDPLAACLAQHTMLVTECNEKQATIDSQKATIDNLNSQINDRNNNIATLNGEISTLKTQLLATQGQVDTLTPIAKQVPQLKDELTQAQYDRTACLLAQEGQNRKIAGLQSALNAAKPKTFIDKLKFLFL